VAGMIASNTATVTAGIALCPKVAGLQGKSATGALHRAVPVTLRYRAFVCNPFAEVARP
jgi:hypothetical protein